MKMFFYIDFGFFIKKLVKALRFCACDDLSQILKLNKMQKAKLEASLSVKK